MVKKFEDDDFFDENETEESILDMPESYIGQDRLVAEMFRQYQSDEKLKMDRTLMMMKVGQIVCVRLQYLPMRFHGGIVRPWDLVDCKVVKIDGIRIWLQVIVEGTDYPRFCIEKWLIMEVAGYKRVVRQPEIVCILEFEDEPEPEPEQVLAAVVDKINKRKKKVKAN